MGRQKCALRVVVFGVVVLCGLVTPVTAFHCPEQVNTIVLPAEEAHSVAVSEGYAYTTHCDTRNGGERAFRASMYVRHRIPSRWAASRCAPGVS